PMAVFLGFEILFLLAALTSKRAGKLDNAISGAALGVGGLAMFWAFYFFSFAASGTRPVLILSLIFLFDAALVVVAVCCELFTVLAGFSILFVAAAAWVSRRLPQTERPGEPENIFGEFAAPANFAVQLPALAATLPFLLLVMATLRLPLANPSPVFGLALLLVALLLGLTKIFSLDLLACLALGSTILLEHAWHFAHFKKENTGIPILWYLGFTAIFTIFPFIFHRQFAGKSTVWASAALAAPLHFYLVYDVVRTTHPHSGMLGLVPAAFAIPSLLGLVALLRLTPKESPARNAQLALFGGAALFFITLIFPIQFDRQWITLGWVLEGAAL